MQHYKAQMLVDTLFLQTVYVLFFIELQMWRVYLAGCTSQPNARCVIQQARQMGRPLEERQPTSRCLIHDRERKFVTAFDTVFQSTHVRTIRTPFCAPNAG
jgi:putative transposase